MSLTNESTISESKSIPTIIQEIESILAKSNVYNHKLSTIKSNQSSNKSSLSSNDSVDSTTDSNESIDKMVMEAIVSNAEYIKTLESEMIIIKSERDALRINDEKLNNVYLENNTLFEQLDLIKRENDKFRFENDNLIKSIEAYSDINKKNKIKIDELTNSENDLLKKYEILQKEQIKIKTEFSDTNSQNTELKVALDNKDETIDSLQSRNENLEYEVSQFNMRQNSINTEKEQYRILFRDREEAKDTLGINIHHLHEENEILRMKLEELTFKHSQAIQKLETIKKDNIVIVKNSDEIQSKQESVYKENISLKTSYSDMSKYFQKLSDHFNSYQRCMKSMSLQTYFPEVEEHMSQLHPLQDDDSHYKVICFIAEELEFWMGQVDTATDGTQDYRGVMSKVGNLTQELRAMIQEFKDRSDQGSWVDSIELLPILNNIGFSLEQVRDSAKTIVNMKERRDDNDHEYLNNRNNENRNSLQDKVRSNERRYFPSNQKNNHQEKKMEKSNLDKRSDDMMEMTFQNSSNSNSQHKWLKEVVKNENYEERREIKNIF